MSDIQQGSTVFTLDAGYLAEKRQELKDDIAYARYRAGENWYRSPIEKAEILQDGHVEATFKISSAARGNITVTCIELYSRNDTRIGSKETEITGAGSAEEIVYVCRINLLQVVPNMEKTGAYDEI